MFNTTTVSGSFNATINTLGSSPSPVGSNPTHASTTMQGGKAVFENDNYRIVASDANDVTIFNKNTGERYQVWGDPHVNVDGQHAFDFWGTTTFELNDGTKLTFETVPAGNGMTLPSKLTITNGDYGARISGIDTNTHGDLKIDEAAGWGRTLDGVLDDGNVLQENASGKGFVAVDDFGRLRQVDQNYINATDLQKGGAQRAAQQEMAELYRSAFQFMSGLIGISLSGALLRNLLGDDAGSGGGRVHAGGTPWFNEAGPNSAPSAGRISLDVDFSFSLTLTRWQG